MAGLFSFSPKRFGLNPRFIPDPTCKEKKEKIGHCCLRKSVISPRKSEEVSDQSETQWVCPRQDRCRNQSQSWLNWLIVGECIRLPGDDLGLIPDLDQDSIAPPIIHVFFTDSQGLRVPDPIGAQSFGGTGAFDTIILKFSEL